MQGELVDGKGEMWHSLAHHTIMFSLLADKLDNTFRRLRGLGKISEKNIADALRDIRLALLEADVEFGVAREFIGRVKTFPPSRQQARPAWDMMLDLPGASPHLFPHGTL